MHAAESTNGAAVPRMPVSPKQIGLLESEGCFLGLIVP
jgi:hypothetical protein